MCPPLMALFFVASAFSVLSRVVSCYDEGPWQPILYDYYQIDLGELGEHRGFGVPASDFGAYGGKIPVPREAIVDVINNLGIKLLAIHNEHNENNIAISPYGAFSVLAALSEGLTGESAHEIVHATHIPKDKHVLRVGLRDIHRHLKSYFIPEEGFLAGLTLNLNNVTLRSEYEDVLHFYGFDYSSFNNALYPEPPTTKKPTEGTTLETGLGLTEEATIPSTSKAGEPPTTKKPTESTTLETGLGLTEGTTIPSISRAGETTIELGNRGGPPGETTATTTSEVLTTVSTTTEGTTIPSTSRVGETTIGPPAESTATTKPNDSTTILATTEANQLTTTTASPATVVTTTTEAPTLATTTIQEELTSISTEASSAPKITTSSSPATTMTEVLKTSEGTEKPATTPTKPASTTIGSPSGTTSTTTEEFLSTTAIPEVTTKLPEATTTEMISTATGTTTETTTLKTTTAKAVETVSLQTETMPRTTNTGRTTREITTVMDISESPSETIVSTEATEATATETTMTEVENGVVNAPTTPAPFEDQPQQEGEETTTPFFFETTPDFQDMPLDQNNFDFNYNYDVNSVQPVYDENTVGNNEVPNPPVDSGNVDTILKRSARSVLDYVIARFYDDHSHFAPPASSRPHYVPQEPLTFAVYGKYRETGVNFMKYDTVLPYFFVPNLKAMALSFPLDSSRYYLLLLLPLRDDGVDQLICDLRLHGNLRYIIGNLRLTHVLATIPSFMLKGYVTLTPTLQRLGIRKVFEPRQADFSPMTNVTDIYVTNIEQAVTVTIRNYLDPSSQHYKNFRQYPPVHFKADHPFLYFVIDSDLHVALMAGKVVNPLNSRIS